MGIDYIKVQGVCEYVYLGEIRRAYIDIETNRIVVHLSIILKDADRKQLDELFFDIIQNYDHTPTLSDFQSVMDVDVPQFVLDKKRQLSGYNA